MASAHDVIQMFGSVEDDQKYGRLLEFMTEDVVYCDPFAGPQRGRGAVSAFMAEMERVIPKMGVYFADWETVADASVGWSRWTMVVPVNGVDNAIPGQSVYRLRDGKVCYAADYVDSAAYRKLRPDVAPDLLSASREAKGTSAAGSADELVCTFWDMQTNARYADLASLFADDSVFTDQVFGRFEGIEAVRQYLTRMETEMPESGARFTLDDHAGDETVAWSQWTCHMANGSFPGWTLHTVRDGKFTLDADYFDVVAARKLQPPRDPR